MTQKTFIEVDGEKVDNTNKRYAVVPAYTVMTQDKINSLGETLTIKGVLDLWWARVEFIKNGKKLVAWKEFYEQDKYHIELDGEDLPEEKTEKLLKEKIHLNQGYDYSNDGEENFPVVSGQLVKEKIKE